jgi:hypothetical protein
MDELRLRVVKSNPDIVAVTESWLNLDVGDGEVAIDNYITYRKDRLERRGGGLVCYIRNSLHSRIEPDLTDSSFKESMWLTIHGGKQEVRLGLVYRSPDCTEAHNEELLQLLQRGCHYRQNTRLLLLGDFNYPEIDFKNYSVQGSPESQQARFFTTVQDLFLHQHVSVNTRHRAGQDPSILDYVFTDEENVIQNLAVTTPLGKSDHAVLEFRYIVQVKDTGKEQLQYNYWKGDYAAINKALADVNWPQKLADMTIDEAWCYWKGTIHTLMQRYIPVKSPSKKVKNRWISKDSLTMIRTRDRAWAAYKKQTTDSSYNIYKQIRNRVVDSIRKDKAIFQEKLIRSFKDCPKRFFSYMRGTQTVRTKVTNVDKENGEVTATDKETADELCRFFHSVFQSEEELQYKSPLAAIQALTVDIEIDAVAVMKKIQQLRSDKTAGPDGIHPHLLKMCADTVSTPLALIYNKSLQAGKVPGDWKLAIVSAIHKKGSRSKCENYRPVSLTSVPCKILESIIKDRLTTVMDSAKLSKEAQHGFTRGKSCLTNLLTALEIWTAALDDGHGIDAIYLDYSKAFDKVPHKRLLWKLKSYGVDNRIVDWIADLLYQRKMCVSVSGEKSDWVEVSSGVPQGSVIGPLLFLLFVNDLPSWVQTGILMFADDTKIWATIRDSLGSKELQMALDQLMDWSKEWRMFFNIDKCKVIHIGHQTTARYFMLADSDVHELEEVEEERDLGIIVSRDLKVAKQCRKAAKAANSVLGRIHRLFRTLDRQSFLILYKSYVRPHLEYCVQAWSPYLKQDIQVLEQVQRRATKMVSGLKDRSYESRLKVLGLTTLHQRRIRGDLIETFKILKGYEKVDASLFFKVRLSSHDLRGHCLTLQKQRCRLDVRQHSFSQRVVSEWNNLPADVIQATSVNAFKNRLDAWWEMRAIQAV